MRARAKPRLARAESISMYNETDNLPKYSIGFFLDLFECTHRDQ